MSKTTRNTLILGGIFILLLALWIWQYSGLASRTKEIREANLRTQATIDSLKAEIATIDSLRIEYELQEALMHQQSKLVVGEDNPSVTYGYLLDIMGGMGLNINFDFAATEPKDTISTYHEYIINGKTRYANLLHLASQIEKQRAVLTIEDFTITTEGAAKADTVNFSMVLHTHFSPNGPSAAEIVLKKLASPYTGYQLFRPYLHEEVLPPEVDPSLLDIEDATLIGIYRGMAFFRDNAGLIRILSKGSPVAWGYLYKVDEAAGKVVFRLDKYGLAEDYTISINNDIQ